MKGASLRTAVLRLQLFKPSEPFVAEQAAALKATDVLLLGRRLFGPPDARLRWWCAAESSRPRNALHALFNRPDILRAPMREHGAELLHAHFAIDALYGLRSAESLRIPLVTTLHGFDVTTRRADFLISGRPALARYALWHRALKQRGDLFIAVSDFIASRAVDAGFPASRVVRHYIGIDLSQFPLAQHGGEPHILHIARLVEKKGTAHLLDAMARVHSRHPGARLVIVGDGPMRATLQAQAQSLGLAAVVRFMGALPHAEVRQLLREASLLALPSVTAANGDAEGLGLVLLEAAASGLPVVGTRHGGIPEAVVDGVTGLLVPERDPSAVADALDALLGDADLRQRLGRAGRAMVEARFDITRQSLELEALYRRLL